MSVTVEFTAEAEAQFALIDAWWRQHRKRVPDVLYDSADRAGVRRYFLRTTGHHIYYVHDDAAHLVTIYSVWNARAGGGPDV